MGVVSGQLACAGLAHGLRAADAAAPAERMRRAFAATNAMVFAVSNGEGLPPGPAGEALYQALDDEARAIFDAARDPLRMTLRGIAAVAVVCELRGDAATIGHAGDARAYRLRGGRLAALTRDHDLASVMPADAGPVPAAYAGVVTRAIGIGPTLEPTTCEVALAAGDVLLLCTDGLHDVAADDAIAAVLAGPGSAAARCDALVALALAGGSAYPDNVAVAIVECT